MSMCHIYQTYETACIQEKGGRNNLVKMAGKLLYVSDTIGSELIMDERIKQFNILSIVLGVLYIYIMPDIR